MPSTRSHTFGAALQTATLLVGALFLVAFLTLLLPGLRGFGILPRTLPGLLGIAFSPMLHANGAHLLANAAPLLVLLTLLFWDRHYHPVRTLALVWLASGVGTWLIGRGDAIHIGASSVIYGLVTYLVACGFLMRSWRSALIAIGVVFVYGGLMYGLLPQRGPISWEGHLSGALAGVWAARQNHA